MPVASLRQKRPGVVTRLPDTSATGTSYPFSCRCSFFRPCFGLYPGGALRFDTLEIRALTGETFPHRFVLEYKYDRNGRRTELVHLSNLAPSATQNRTTYDYDDDTGELTSVLDALQNEFRFEYNARGELRTLRRPGATIEQYTYDPAGRLVGDTVTNVNAAGGKLRATVLR